MALLSSALKIHQICWTKGEKEGQVKGQVSCSKSTSYLEVLDICGRLFCFRMPAGRWFDHRHKKGGCMVGGVTYMACCK